MNKNPQQQNLKKLMITRFEDDDQDYDDESPDIPSVTRKISQRFTMDKLMMLLDKKKLEALEEEFQQQPEGIKLCSFVWLMKAAVNHSDAERHDLVYGLQKLFSEIDINGDERMEWTEFTQYIIDAVIQNQANPNKSKDLLLETKIMKFKKYSQSKLKDKTSHSSHIQNAIWCQKFQALMVIEHHQKQIKVMSLDLQPKFSIHLPPSTKEIYIIDIDYSNEHSTFGCVDSDCNIIFWEYYISLKMSKTIKASCVQTQIKYLKQHKTWLTVGTDHNIREYDLSKAEPLILLIEGHKKTILEIVELNNPFAIATASLDTTIRIYSLIDKEEIAVLTEHRMGVRSITYNPNFGGFIVSAGFERDLYVWSPELATKKSLIGKLEGHMEIVVCVRFLNTKPYCVSIDEKFNMRFWDVRSFQCVQVIANEAKAQIPCYGMMILPAQERFIVFSKRFLYYDTKKKDNVNKQVNMDDVIPILGDFNRYYLSFFVVTQQDLRIYDAKDGKLQRIIQNIQDPKTQSPISAFCTDDRQRKFYVGDQMGAIRQYNISNGVLIKNVQKPFSKKIETTNAQLNLMQQYLTHMDSHEISQLKFLSIDQDHHHTQLLVSTSWDSSLKVFDEEVPEESKILRHTVGGHVKEDISIMEVNVELSLIATGSCSGLIAIWDFETNKLEKFFCEHTKAISSLHFLYPLPILVSTCNEGYVCFWGLKQGPHEFKHKLIKKIRNNMIDSDMCFLLMNITAAKIKKVKQQGKDQLTMIIGDESGYIHKWNLDIVEEEFRQRGFQDVDSINSQKTSFNPKKNAFVHSETNAATMLFFNDLLKLRVKSQNSQNYIKELQWFAHFGQVSNIQFLSSPDGVITCSHDRHVKLWSLKGEMWGDINLLKENYDKQWVYPFDWSEKQEEELTNLKMLMHYVEGDNKKNMKEVVQFEQQIKKTRDQRETIDYLAKRKRRQEIEEQQRRQQERNIKLQNDELLKVHFITEQTLNAEVVQNDNFKEELRRIEEEQLDKKTVKKGLALSIDRHIENKITEAELKIRFNLRNDQDEESMKRTEHTINFTNNSPLRTASQQNPRKTQFLMRKSFSQASLQKSKKKLKKVDKNHEFNQMLFAKANLKIEAENQTLLQPIQPNDPLQNIQHSAAQLGQLTGSYASTKVSFFEPKPLVKFNPKIHDFKDTIITPKNLKSALIHMKHDLASPVAHTQSTVSTKKKIGFFEPQPSYINSKASTMNRYSSNSQFNNAMKMQDKIDQIFKQTQKRFQTLAYSLSNLDDKLDFNRVPESHQPKRTSTAGTFSQERRVLIGMEGAKGSRFIKKLNNFIGTVKAPSSRITDRVKDVKFSKGEGMRLLKLNYANNQYENKVLQANEFGFNKKEPKPAKKNIFENAPNYQDAYD